MNPERYKSSRNIKHEHKKSDLTDEQRAQARFNKLVAIGILSFSLLATGTCSAILIGCETKKIECVDHTFNSNNDVDLPNDGDSFFDPNNPNPLNPNSPISPVNPLSPFHKNFGGGSFGGF